MQEGNSETNPAAAEAAVDAQASGLTAPSGGADASASATVGAGPFLEMSNISKEFYGVRVLDDVSISAERGKVHAIMGENGAGKSTLMKILAGVYSPTEGSISIGGERLSFQHPLQAQQAGVAIIYQEFNLLPDRTVAENVYLSREPRRGPFVDRRAMERGAAELLAEVAPDSGIRPDALVGSLPVAGQQTVEIAKAMSLDAKILVMDEPTAALAAHEVEQLFDQVRRLTAKGLAILYISHRIPEIFELSDSITVLKDGSKVDTVETGSVSGADLVRMMVGRDLAQYFPPRAERSEVGDPMLKMVGAGNKHLRDISFEVRCGEVVGVAGLQGAGRTELARAIFGVAPFTKGRLELDGKVVHIKNPRQAIRAGIGFVTEDRKAEGLALGQSIRDNVTMVTRALTNIFRRRRGTGRAKPLSVSELTESVELKAQGLGQEVRFLSGGNQQKVVIAKWLATEPRLVIFDEPTRGIDVGAKAGIHDLIRGLARQGVAILMISSELPEVIGMSDRVIVLRAGEIAGELAAGPTEPEIMLLATGEKDIAAEAADFDLSAAYETEAETGTDAGSGTGAGSDAGAGEGDIR